MQLIPDKEREQVREVFDESLARPVKLFVFTQEFECDFCRETRQLIEELADLSDHVHVEVYDFLADTDMAAKYGIDKIPAVAVLGDDEDDTGIRFFGIPSGYEFASLLEAIKLIGGGELDLSDETLDFLAEVDQPVHIQVFVTPTCPYCPRAVVLGHQLAYASPRVRADMVEATEFPHLAMKYNVMGVPRTVINEETHIEGAVPEPMLLSHLRSALAAGA
jgi:glutaredoxin-like protein